jgi:cell division cycle protein 20 (cofactor of APC complex)
MLLNKKNDIILHPDDTNSNNFINNASSQPQVPTNSQNTNINHSNSNINFHNLMLDSLLLKSSESFSFDKQNWKNITNESRVLSFTNRTANIPNNLPHKTPIISQIRSLLGNKSLTDTFHINKTCPRIISPTPERILDAPQLLDDYYLNLIDWSSQNILAVSLGNSVYLWNGNTYETLQLMTNQDNICSLNWMNSGNLLAVGLKDGHVELWDTAKLQQIRKMAGHTDRVSSLSWNVNLLSSGSKDSQIINHDVRLRNQKIHLLKGHSQEVCALKWAPDGSLLASGGNDNLLCIWDLNYSTSQNSQNRFNRASSILNDNQNTYSQQTGSLWNLIQENTIDTNNLVNSGSNLNQPIVITPRYNFTSHEAAVKALAWCPWQKGLLASGAGTRDKTIKFWNLETGSLINTVDTGSQVCALLWSKHEKELISSHGYAKNQISFWKYPSMQKLTELNGHMSRVLYLSMSPDGYYIASGAGDETLRFWKIHDNKKPMLSSYCEEPEVNFKESSSKMLNGFQIR